MTFGLVDSSTVAGAAVAAGTVGQHPAVAWECRSAHKDYLIAAGFEVIDRVVAAGLADVKQALGVPASLVVSYDQTGGYVVERHARVHVIDALALRLASQCELVERNNEIQESVSVQRVSLAMPSCCGPCPRGYLLHPPRA